MKRSPHLGQQTLIPPNVPAQVQLVYPTRTGFRVNAEAPGPTSDFQVVNAIDYAKPLDTTLLSAAFAPGSSVAPVRKATAAPGG
jgi:hypothetical protein